MLPAAGNTLGNRVLSSFLFFKQKERGVTPESYIPFMVVVVP